MSTALKDIQLTAQDANVVILRLILLGASKLTFETSDISDEHRAELIKARDRFIERTRENLRYAERQANG